ncbi:hypothetical protein NL676_032980 [Syzygium grande]|nr:hypothetical protein NL676_032980 [Syzygium grande]
MNLGLRDINTNEFLIQEYLISCLLLPHLSSLDSGLQQLPIGTRSRKNPEGSLGYLSQAGVMKQSVIGSTRSEDSKSLSEQPNFLGCAAAAKGKAICKQLIAEQERKTMYGDRIHTLRSLVPKISKLDKNSILGDAVDYIKDLQMEVRNLKEERGKSLARQRDNAEMMEGMKSLGITVVDAHATTLNGKSWPVLCSR